MKRLCAFVKGVLLSSSVCLPLLSADPPYPVDVLEGRYFESLSSNHKAVFVPGRLDRCVATAGGYPSTTWICDVVGGELTIHSRTGAQRVSLSSIQVGDVSDPTEPKMDYDFAGTFRRVMPDGNTYEVEASLRLHRSMHRPDNWNGDLNIGRHAIHGGIILHWAGSPDPL